MPIRRSTRARTDLTSNSSPPAKAAPGRPRRTTSGSTVEITRDEPNSPDDPKKALRLTMKMPSSKLREATSNPKSRPSSRGNAAAKLTDSLTGGEIVSGPRASRANKKYVVESESDDDTTSSSLDSSTDHSDQRKFLEEEQDDDESEEEEAEEAEEIGGPEESDEDEDAEGDLDADGDIEMEDDVDDGQPLPSQTPILKVNGPAGKPASSRAPTKPTVTVTPAKADKVKSVEDKEMEMEDDDEELSELSDDDEEGDAGEEDAEGDLDEEMGDDDGSRSPGSRGSTPDVSKMTKRQLSRLNQVMGSDFLQLPMGTYELEQ